MELFKNKYFIIFRYVRIISYIFLFAIFIIIPTSYFKEHNNICFFYNNFNFLCPSCGITRAFSSMMHLKFIDALNYNPIFTIAIGPIFIFLFLEDLVTILINMIAKKNRYSIIEYIVLRYL